MPPSKALSPVPPAGVWAPAITFFEPETDNLDLPSQSKYYAYLSKHLTGLVILGTNAETFLLTPAERKTLITTARSAVGPNYPLMAGCGGHSTRQVLEFIADAKDAGADYALVLPCAYLGPATTKEIVMNFYNQIAKESGLPIVIYNFPGVCNGVDIDSDMIESLAKAHPGKIVGVKLTCGSVAKVVRLAAALKGPNEDPEEGFAVFGGQSDFLLGALESGSSGCIAAFGNVFPKAITKIYTFWSEGRRKEALALHQKAARAEQGVKGGIASVKYASAVFCAGRDGRGGIEDAEKRLRPRRPYVEVSDGMKDKIREAMREMDGIEEGIRLVAK